MRIEGQLRGRKVSILVDTGSNRNFICEKAANALGCRVENQPAFDVVVGDGSTLKCRGRCTQQVLEIHGHKFSMELFPLAMAGADLVLGVQWQRSLGYDRAPSQQQSFFHPQQPFPSSPSCIEAPNGDQHLRFRWPAMDLVPLAATTTRRSARVLFLWQQSLLDFFRQLSLTAEEGSGAVTSALTSEKRRRSPRQPRRRSGDDDGGSGGGGGCNRATAQDDGGSGGGGGCNRATAQIWRRRRSGDGGGAETPTAAPKIQRRRKKLQRRRKNTNGDGNGKRTISPSWWL
ncbi:hypothetical protein EJ110_NYTH47266 [Nymphaea thermarum]|nr:hypothetical protein EJ110_NYTH47266 [Nymphaea thermarum]